MRKELDDLLCQRYPAIFAERADNESSMGGGFWCRDGWFVLIDTLCERLQYMTDHRQAPQPVARQVKEKFGKLVFYCHGKSEMQSGMIDMAQAMSAHICEECGAPGEVLVDGCTLMARCPTHTPEGAITAAEFQRKMIERKVGR